MSRQSYTINKGVDRPLEFKGLKAQYVTWLAGGLIGLLLAFVVLYMIGMPALVCAVLIIGSGLFLFSRVYALSRRWGQYGLMKHRAARRLPTVIRARSRKPFIRS